MISSGAGQRPQLQTWSLVPQYHRHLTNSCLPYIPASASSRSLSCQFKPAAGRAPRYIGGCLCMLLLLAMMNVQQVAKMDLLLIGQHLSLRMQRHPSRLACSVNDAVPAPASQGTQASLRLEHSFTAMPGCQKENYFHACKHMCRCLPCQHT